jgi:hypothetical protein
MSMAQLISNTNCPSYGQINLHRETSAANNVEVLASELPDSISTFFSRSFSQVAATFSLMKSSITPYPKESLKQFNEVVIPRVVAGETNPKLIAKETAISLALINRLSEVTFEQIKQFLDVIDTLDFQHAQKDSVLLNPKLPHIALETLRRGLLDSKQGQIQVATLLNFWSALQYHGDSKTLTTVSVFAPEAAALIKETLLNSCDTKTEPFLNGDLFALFLEKLKAFPLSEQRFLLVDDLQGNLTSHPENPYTATVSQALKVTGVNVFNRVISKKLRIIPSAGMMQAFLDAQYGDNAVKIKPRISLSTTSHIYDTRLTDTNDLMFSTPGEDGNSRCPEKADGYLAPWYDFPYHDFYHAICSSAVGKTYRKVGILASNLIRSYAKIAPSHDQKGLHQLAFNFVDMEYPAFHHYVPAAFNITPPIMFWLTINVQFLYQAIQFEVHQAFEQKGVSLPFRIFPISKESQLGVLNRLVSAFVHQGLGPEKLNFETFKEAISFCKNNPGKNHPLLWLEKPFFQDSDSDESEEPALPDWIEEALPRNSLISTRYLEDEHPLNSDVMPSSHNDDFLDRDDEDIDGFIL